MEDERHNMLSYKGKLYMKIYKRKHISFTHEKKKLIKFLLITCIIILNYINFENIEIDNKIFLYEKNINYSNLTTDIKTIALYLPQFHSIKENDKWWGKGFTEWTNVKDSKPLYKGHHQPRIPGDSLNYLGYYELINLEVIQKQINLAKSHGVYGFGIYYYWFSGRRLLESPLDLFLINKNLDFKFLLIWANENWTRRWNGLNKKILIKQEYNDNDPINFIIDIKKYLIDKRYIKINEKPIIGLYEPKNIPNLKKIISQWREESIKLGIGEIFILVTLNNNTYEEFKKIGLFNGVYEFSPRDSFNCKIKYSKNLLYTATLYKNINFINATDDFPLFRGSMLEFDNSPRIKNSPNIFENYSPEQFYLINKKIIEWTREHYNINNRFIFINAWNEWGEGAYLEPDEKYGYASINSLSKALFDKDYKDINFNFEEFNIRPIIAIQAHIFYIDLLNEIIVKINNIPVKFDLFISTDSLFKKNNIQNYIKQYSKASNINVIIIENIGRDVLPLLIQMKNVIKNYKYLCHIHTKKTMYTNIGNDWRNYLLENLLGNQKIISEILSDFENNEKLGFIFPENYYKVLFQFGIQFINRNNKSIIIHLLKKYFHKFRIGKKLEFPAGNMFWARVKAIYQIFNEKYEKNLPIEIGQKDGTIMHGIERIWLYLVKLNGYYYNKIFKHF